MRRKVLLAQLLLPRLLDVVYLTMQLLTIAAAGGVGVEYMVLDFKEAFWQLPLSPEERRFFCAMLTMDGIRKYLVYLRTVQGSRGAPLTWARTAALLLRLTVSLFPLDRIRALCFVDAH